MSALPDYGKGRLLHHDPASRAYGAPTAKPVPRSVSHRINAEALNQDGMNACVGFTFAQLLNCAAAMPVRQRFNRALGRPSRWLLEEAHALRLYELATEHDPFDWVYPPVDNGSSGLGGAKALHKLGMIGSYAWTFDFATAIGHAQLQPVAVGTIWTAAMDDPDSRGIIRIGSAAQVNEALDRGIGHEYLWRGVNWPRKLARIRNSWGEQWGDDGEAWIPLDDLEMLIMKYQGDVCVPRLV
ncbi:hypothetical protein PBI_THONKO_77 [Mycobacterium phage Thonko]|uniref:Cysteine protease n=1 Tax=Mycobacterium phage Thonko TaxID=2282910 RepID=A0A346FCC3_9CAUD|nr:peptidase [Mycobacterium phage Thonko]AXN53348.1 hypothetical protein PBI_THONKO_77 [Mycobacterium phage Thonko]